MPRRLALSVLVIALVGSMVGVGVAASRRAPDVALGAENSEPAEVTTSASEPAAAPSTEPAARPTIPHEPIEARTPEAEPADADPTDPPTTEAEEPTEDADIADAQRRLTELGYYVGPIDGDAGPGTASAVMAFQKVNALSADGVIGPNTRAALKDPVTPSLRGGPANRVEVDLTKQVLYYVRGNTLERILPVSSGSGETYRTASGGTARSLTPIGTYTVERRIRGVREANLGTLYDPMYYYKGWAIHGSNSVPAYPASHGCVRVTRADAKWLFDRLPVGTTVVLYGGTHTFAAGSGAAGTDTPAGDTGSAAKPDAEPKKSPTPEPKKSPTPAPKQAAPNPTKSPAPEPAKSPDPAPRPAESPAQAPKPAAPTPAPTPTDTATTPAPTPTQTSVSPPPDSAAPTTAPSPVPSAQQTAPDGD